MREHGLPARLEEVRLVGGGSQSALWRQIVADTFDVRVACPAEPESAALGAALQAAAVDAGAGAALGERSTTAAANPFCCTTSAVLAAVVAADKTSLRTLGHLAGKVCTLYLRAASTARRPWLRLPWPALTAPPRCCALPATS